MEPITLPGKLRSIPQVIEYALEAGDRAKLGKRAQNRLRLAVEEFATNIITHGYQEAGLAGDIVIGADMDEKVLRITLEDTGEPFDPRQQPPPPDLDRPLDERSIGGMGIYLALQNVDEFDYEYTDGCNRNYIFIHRP
ncbi:MAG TPA: ATP-binding protein, partial [Aggregatilineales bacterium]|nr:ATP-binding protein [Aggregatilineales bacterium]